MDYDSFSHGQVASKLWLCEQLEPFVKEGSDITILGSWHNVLGFMLSVRRPNYYKNILGIDSDPEVIRISDKITDYWKYGSHRIRNMCEDANELKFINDEVLINCSAEHFNNDVWYENIPAGTLICIQSSDMTDPEHPWLITYPNPTIEAFVERYPVSKTLYLDTLNIDYDNWGYKRFMLIGIK